MVSNFCCPVSEVPSQPLPLGVIYLNKEIALIWDWNRSWGVLLCTCSFESICRHSWDERFCQSTAVEQASLVTANSFTTVLDSFQRNMLEMVLRGQEFIIRRVEPALHTLEGWRQCQTLSDRKALEPGREAKTSQSLCNWARHVLRCVVRLSCENLAHPPFFILLRWQAFCNSVFIKSCVPPSFVFKPCHTGQNGCCCHLQQFNQV